MTITVQLLNIIKSLPSLHLYIFYIYLNILLNLLLPYVVFSIFCHPRLVASPPQIEHALLMALLNANIPFLSLLFFLSPH